MKKLLLLALLVSPLSWAGYDGSGNYTLPQPLPQAGQLARAAQLNSIFNDIATALTTAYHVAGAPNTNASLLSSGTLPIGRLPAYTGDCASIIGTNSLVCTTTNGVAFAASATTDATNVANVKNSGTPILNASNIWTVPQSITTAAATASGLNIGQASQTTWQLEELASSNSFTLATVSNGPVATVNNVGSWNIPAAASGFSTVTINGVAATEASNIHGLVVMGSSTTGQSMGILAQAGTNASDHGLVVKNQAGTVSQFEIFGDGSGGSYRGAFFPILHWVPAGNVAVSAPTSGVAFTSTGLANAYSVLVNGDSTAGQSLGLQVKAGTNSSDFALNVLNQAATVAMFNVAGDTSFTFQRAGLTPTLRGDANGAISIATPSAGLALTIAGGGMQVGGITTGTNADFLCLTAGGLFTLQASACTISSLRFKEHLNYQVPSVLGGLNKLHVASYNMKPDKQPNADPNFATRQIGLIAENIAQVFPECAIYDRDMKTPKSYRQECVIALLVKGEQELMQQNAKLEQRLQSLGLTPSAARKARYHLRTVYDPR